MADLSQSESIAVNAASLADMLGAPQDDLFQDAEGSALCLLVTYMRAAVVAQEIAEAGDERFAQWGEIALLVVSAFTRLQGCFPDVDAIQEATIHMESNESRLELISSVLDSPIVIPVELDRSREDPTYREDTYVRACEFMYGPTQTVSDLARKPSTNVPTPTDVRTVAGLIAATGFGCSEVLERIDSSPVLFGFAFEWPLPWVSFVNTLWSFSQDLSRQLSEARISRASKALAVRVLWELVTLAWTMEVCGRLQWILQTDQRPDDIEFVANVLTRAALEPGFPKRREIAAEFAGYLWNRLSQENDSSAAELPRAALSNFHFSYIFGRNPRLAKYVAQSMLDVGLRRDDQAIVDMAESVWLDNYIAPHLATTVVSRSTYDALAWNSPMFAASPHVRYEDIPAYAQDPRYLYAGAAKDVLAVGASSYAGDLWASSVLLVQRYKDVSGEVGLPPHVSSLALYELSEDDELAFPMRQRHPIAWLYFYSDRLLWASEQGPGHPGLQAPNEATRKAQRRLAAIVEAFGQRVDGLDSKRTARFSVPDLARQLLEPAAGGQRKWAFLAEAWSAS